MRILVNDYAGHPFQVHLSRALARRGHKILHAYCASVQTPRGALARSKTDSANFDVAPIPLSRPFNRYGLITRVVQEMELGRLLVNEVDSFHPDVVLSANTPLGTQAALLKRCRKSRIKFVFWVQDLLGVGIRNNVVKKLPVLGNAVGWLYIRLEELLLRKSDEVVVITEDFCPIMERAGVTDSKVHVIQNWAPLDEVLLYPKTNPWSKEYGLDQKLCVLYSGTLGMKHNPQLLVELALYFQNRNDVRIVVITEGLGADYLIEKKEHHGLDNLILMPFQPFDTLPMVLASADVLIAILEPDAGVFAVPSKVLTYLCAKRPLILAVPPENLAARIVSENQAGIVVSPSDSNGFISAAKKLLDDSVSRTSFADNGREYAELTFDIERITDRFEKILLS